MPCSSLLPCKSQSSIIRYRLVLHSGHPSTSHVQPTTHHFFYLSPPLITHFSLHLCIKLQASYFVYTLPNNLHTHKVPLTPHTQPKLQVNHLTPQVHSHTSCHSTSKEQTLAPIAGFVFPYPCSPGVDRRTFLYPRRKGTHSRSSNHPPTL